MSIETVKRYFALYDMDTRIIEFAISSATVELAAIAVGCEAKQIAKTMAFSVEDTPILIVAAGDAKIANAKYKAQFGVKAKMIPLDEVEQRIGHAVGGVCPFAVHTDVSVYLDVSLKRFATVFPAAGSSNSAIEMSPAELEQYSHAVAWVDVCKDWE